MDRLDGGKRTKIGIHGCACVISLHFALNMLNKEQFCSLCAYGGRRLAWTDRSCGLIWDFYMKR